MLSKAIQGAGGQGGGNVGFSNLVTTIYNPNNYGTPDYDYFAQTLIANDTYLFAGVTQEDDANDNSGVVYIFDLSDFSLVTTITNPNNYGTTYNDLFGFSIAFNSNYLFVSATFEDDASGNQSGIVYVFSLSDFSLVTTITNPNAYGTSENDQFGRAMAANDTYLVVGTPEEANATGKVYIFNISDFSLATTINNPAIDGTDSNDAFGTAVVLNDTHLFASAVRENVLAGVVYVFSLSDFSLVTTITNPNAYGSSYQDYFAYYLALNSNYLFAGVTSEDDAGGTSSGVVYVFSLSDFSLVTTITNPNNYDTSANDYFGSSVIANDTYLYVGAYGEDDAGGLTSGVVYVFDLSNFSLVTTITNPNSYGTSDGDYFGAKIYLNSSYLFAKAQNEDTASSLDSGVIYVFG